MPCDLIPVRQQKDRRTCNILCVCYDRLERVIMGYEKEGWRTLNLMLHPWLYSSTGVSHTRYKTTHQFPMKLIPGKTSVGSSKCNKVITKQACKIQSTRVPGSHPMKSSMYVTVSTGLLFCRRKIPSVRFIHENNHHTLRVYIGEYSRTDLDQETAPKQRIQRGVWQFKMLADKKQGRERLMIGK